MSTRSRSLLSAFALAVTVFTCAAAAPVDSLPGEPERAAAARLGHPKPHPRPRPAPEPTVGERAAKIALEAVGVPYRWGGESPGGGFDCSGLVRWTYGRLGIDVPHSSYALWSTGRPVARTSVEAGDVLVFSGLGHVGLYLGRDRMVHAPQSGRTVEVVGLSSTNYGSRLVGARRVTGA
jgi:cell wall-associated NlpC family hydrolase